VLPEAVQTQLAELEREVARTSAALAALPSLGGWTEDEHAVFLRVKGASAIPNPAAATALARKLVIELPHRSEDACVAHCDWAAQLAALQARKRDLAVEYRTLKRSAEEEAAKAKFEASREADAAREAEAARRREKEREEHVEAVKRWREEKEREEQVEQERRAAAERARAEEEAQRLERERARLHDVVAQHRQLKHLEHEVARAEQEAEDDYQRRVKASQMAAARARLQKRDEERAAALANAQAQRTRKREEEERRARSLAAAAQQAVLPEPVARDPNRVVRSTAAQSKRAEEALRARLRGNHSGDTRDTAIAPMGAGRRAVPGWMK
jgi:hypothetical protein